MPQGVSHWEAVTLPMHCSLHDNIEIGSCDLTLRALLAHVDMAKFLASINGLEN